jgi:hypothetical protein
MSGAPHVDASNKAVALLISVLALLLAISETLGNAAQTLALTKNTEAANMWSFFQGKTIRATTLSTAADMLEADNATNDKQKKLVEKWRATVKRYNSEPETGEGRKELAARAKAFEKTRDTALAAHHYYELAAASVQIGIVVASASIIVSLPLLTWAGVVAGMLGTVLIGIGYFAPTLHLF